MLKISVRGVAIKSGSHDRYLSITEDHLTAHESLSLAVQWCTEPVHGFGFKFLAPGLSPVDFGVKPIGRNKAVIKQNTGRYLTVINGMGAWAPEPFLVGFTLNSGSNPHLTTPDRWLVGTEKTKESKKTKESNELAD